MVLLLGEARALPFENPVTCRLFRARRGRSAMRQAVGEPLSGGPLILLNVHATSSVSIWPQLEFGGLYAERISISGCDLAEKGPERISGGGTGRPAGARVALDGDPAAESSAYAHKHAVDLVVMPTHGYGPFRRFILGSNTAKVSARCGLPGVDRASTWSRPPPPWPPLRHIFVRGGPGAAKPEDAGSGPAWMRRNRDAASTLLHVTAASRAERLAVTGLAAAAREIREAVAEELDRPAAGHGLPGNVLIKAGERPRAICAAAERLRTRTRWSSDGARPREFSGACERTLIRLSGSRPVRS